MVCNISNDLWEDDIENIVEEVTIKYEEKYIENAFNTNPSKPLPNINNNLIKNEMVEELSNNTNNSEYSKVSFNFVTPQQPIHEQPITIKSYY